MKGLFPERFAACEIAVTDGKQAYGCDIANYFLPGIINVDTSW